MRDQVSRLVGLDGFRVVDVIEDGDQLDLEVEPDVDVPMVERIAAGNATSTEVAGWLEARTASSG